MRKSHIFKIFLSLFFLLLLTEQAHANTILITVEWIDAFGDSIDKTTNRIAANMKDISLYLLVLMATIDMVFFFLFNVGQIAQNGLVYVIPDLFKRVIMWSILTYAITTLTGPGGESEIIRIAYGLTGQNANGSLPEFTPGAGDSCIEHPSFHGCELQSADLR